MRIVIHESSRATVEDVKNIVTRVRYEFKRGNTGRVEVQFADDSGEAFELPNPATGVFMLKNNADYTGPAIVASLAWTQEGTGASALYVFTPNFNTNELNALLLLGESSATVADNAARYALTDLDLDLQTIVFQTDTGAYWIVIDPEQLDNAAGWALAPMKPSIVLLGEIEWTYESETYKSSTFQGETSSDLIRGVEGIPTDALPSYPPAAIIVTNPSTAVENNIPRFADATGTVIEDSGVSYLATVPSGGTTGQVLAKVSGTSYAVAWTDSGASPTWGNIIGDIGDQTDLMEELGAKQDQSSNLDALSGNTGSADLSGVTLTLPADVTRLGNSIDLSTDVTGSLPWASVSFTGSSLADLETRDADDLTGTLPDAVFPAELPGISGVNLTDISASQLTTGTIPDGRFPLTIPASSGANLTALNASELATGTIPSGRFPATLPASSGANLTGVMKPGNNLSDVTNVGTSRANLGLEYASPSETIAGASSTLIVNPAGLASVDRSYRAKIKLVLCGF